MFFHESGLCWKILDNEQLIDLHNVLDNTMKGRHSMGLGLCESAEIITIDYENKLFEDGILGEDSPLKLLCTIVYMYDWNALCTSWWSWTQ